MKKLILTALIASAFATGTAAAGTETPVSGNFYSAFSAGDTTQVNNGGEYNVNELIGGSVTDGGKVSGDVFTAAYIGDVTQINEGGSYNLNEIIVGSVVGVEVKGSFTSYVNTGSITQLNHEGSYNQNLVTLGSVTP